MVELDDQFYPRKADDQKIIDACINGSIQVINEFLLSGHNVNKPLNSGWTLLLYAASYAQPDVVEHLINKGANPNIHYDGFTPLMALSNSASSSPQKRFQCLKYLLDSHANIESVSKIKETALMFACKMQEIDFVSELLEHTKDLNCYDSEQKTALFYAVADNRYEIANLLIERGADVNWINFRGSSVYDIAITKGCDQLIPLLCKDEKLEQREIISERTLSWFNMFPTMAEKNLNSLDSDVSSILCGMGLDGYKSLFCGMNLKTVLQLTENDLKKIGIDIGVHRKRFIEDLLRFHKCEWGSALMKIDRSQPFTTFEAIKFLGNLQRQLLVMSCGLNFAETWYNEIKKNENIKFTSDDQEKYETSINEMQKITVEIQDVIGKIRHTAELINKENSHLTLPIYIGKKSKFNCKWIALTVITAITSIYLFRMKSMNN